MTKYAVWRTPNDGSYGLCEESRGPLEVGDELLATFDAPDWETAKRKALDIQTADWVTRPEFAGE